MTGLETDENGSVIRTFLSHGSLDGQVNDPRVLAIHQNTIFVADGANHRVVAPIVMDFLFNIGGNVTEMPMVNNQPYGLVVSETINELYVGIGIN